MYYGMWDKKEDVQGDFSGYGCGWGDTETYGTGDLTEEFETIDVLVAWYDCEDYEGSAFVLFSQNGKLYEVHGGHCSCYGLEGQWGPEETSATAILHRMKKGHEFDYIPKPRRRELKNILLAYKMFE